MSAIYDINQLDLDGGLAAEGGSPRRRSWLAGGVATLTAFFVAQLLHLFPVLEGLQLAKLTVVLVGIGFLLSPGGWASRLRIGSVRPLKHALALFAFALITIPFSEWRSASLAFFAEVLAKNGVFFYLLVQAARTDRDSRVIVGALIAGSAFLSLSLVTGFSIVSEKLDPGRLAIGKTYDSNDLALLFVVTIPFAFFLLKPSGAVVRVLLGCSIALMLTGMVKTGSRGGFLGLLVIAALIVFRSSRQVRRYALLAVAIGIILLSFVAPDYYWDRISTIYNYQQDYNLNDSGGRLMIWQTGLRMIADHPVAGVGVGCFSLVHAALSASGREIAAHNTLLQVAAELGLIGLFLFLSITVASMRAARLLKQRSTELAWLGSALEVSFIGFLVAGFFLSHAYSAIFWFLAGMGVAAWACVNKRESEDSRDELDVEF